MKQRTKSAPMTIDEHKAYSRGYSKRAEQWPEHRPPLPPDPVIAELMAALQELRDTCDTFRATLMPDDEFGAELEPGITRADKALTAVSLFLRTGT